MLYRIKFISDEVDGFLREIKIDSEATFLDLNKAILSACNYPDDQLTSFYICDEEWERGTQITREDMGLSNSEEDIFVMEKTRLSDFIEDAEQHLAYVFDPFNNRCFYLDVKEVIPGENLETPIISRSKGNAPKQLEELDLDLSTINNKSNTAGEYGDLEDSSLFESSDYNDDEIDFEGFEISDGKPF